MSGRMRSPRYPSTSIGQAIDLIGKLHQTERRNPIEREVAAKALGYSGITGRSATVLADLVQYGFLEKTGSNEVRATDLAVEILHPESAASRDEALLTAAQKPVLFQSIKEKFSDGDPSEEALKSFFVREGFTDTAIPAAIRAYKETFSYLENAIESGSISVDTMSVVESQSNQSVEETPSMSGLQLASQPGSIAASHGAGGSVQNAGSDKPRFELVDGSIRLGGGVIPDQAEAKRVIALITALMPTLKTGEEEDDADD